MLIRQLNHTKKLLSLQTASSHKSLSHKSHSQMSSSISEWVRKFMNRIKFQDNRAIEAKQDKFTVEIHQTPEEVDANFIGNEKYKSVVEKERMQKIDEAIGTRTYFHETKPFQERIDSDHVMEIEELLKKHKEPRRNELNWQNPQATPQYKIKSSRKFYRNLKNLREYPKHNYRMVDFSDEKSQESIDFLGKESLYTKLSLKWVDTYQKSLQTQTIQDVSYQLQSQRYSPLYVYFSSIVDESKLYRIQHKSYTPQLQKSATKFTQLHQHIEEVISLQQIYSILKEHYHDERVSEWLRKVENGEMGYLLSGYKANREEGKVVVWVDLLGTKKEYVHLYKNLDVSGKRESKENAQNNRVEKGQKKTQQANNTQKQSSSITSHNTSNPLTNIISTTLFNCKPNIAFSATSSSIFMIQRSQQGTYVQLVRVSITPSDSLSEPQLIYKCKAYEQMEIVDDESLGYVMVKVSEVGKWEDGRVMIVEEDEQGKVELVLVEIGDLRQERNGQKSDQPQTSTQQQKSQPQTSTKQQKSTNIPPKSRILINSCPQGLLVTQFYSTQNQFFKYGSSKQFARQVTVIPYKSHIQLAQQSSSKLQAQYQIAGSLKIQKKRPSAKELDFGRRTVMFACGQEEFITEISVRQSHLILTLSTHSIYHKKRIHFLPYQQSKNPHSLIFNTESLSLINFGYCYSSQTVNFLINRSLVFNEYYQYTIWKKELKELTEDDVYIEKVQVDDSVGLTVTVLKRYLDLLPKFFVDRSEGKHDQGQASTYQMEKSQVPVLIYLVDSKSANNQPSHSQTRSEVQLKKFLQKGTLIITVACRGTLSSDLLTFYNGSGQNFPNLLSDLQRTIEWIGNTLGSNISLYAKGPISSLTGMMLNVRYPFLFTATVLHDGVYELLDRELFYGKVDYFVRFKNLERDSEKFVRFWKYFNPATFLFKKSNLVTKKILDQNKQDRQHLAKKQTSINSTQRQKLQHEEEEINEEKKEVKDVMKQFYNFQSLHDLTFPQIGSLQNILISCSTDQFSKSQSRRMVHRLRQNKNLRYSEVFLKEFMLEEDEELFNLAYIWGRMKDRLQEESRDK